MCDCFDISELLETVDFNKLESSTDILTRAIYHGFINDIKNNIKFAKILNDDNGVSRK